MTTTATVIVPAHNEARALPRLLSALAVDLPPHLEVIVVCNGCTDDSADVARRWADVRVVEISEASKSAALVRGDEEARHPTRAYIDADVVISQADVEVLVDALRWPVLATSAERRLELSHSSLVVRWYYAVWSRLPQVEESIFGRGVVVVSAEGHERVRALPRVMSDDLAMAEAFAPRERSVVRAATVLVNVPHTLSDLLRRRVRVATGVAELDRKELRSSAARTSPQMLLRMGLRSPAMLPKLVVFLVLSVEVRRRARRQIRAGDFTTWLRDESSRL